MEIVHYNPTIKFLKNMVEKDVEFIVKEWPNILENINRIRPTVGSIVEDFIPTF